MDLYRGINDFRKGYQPRTNVRVAEKCDLVRDFYSILATLRKQFFQLLNVYGVNDSTQIEIHPGEPKVPKSSSFEIDLAI